MQIQIKSENGKKIIFVSKNYTDTEVSKTIIKNLDELYVDNKVPALRLYDVNNIKCYVPRETITSNIVRIVGEDTDVKI